MTDIFISYSSQDREWIKKFIDILEINNFDIWWDSYIDTGSHYPKQIENALNSAECVIVVWSDFSVNSEWIYSEARNAFERKILIPVKIDESKIPLPFDTVQTIDMSSWDWSKNHNNYKLLLDNIYNFVKIKKILSLT